MNLRPDKTLLLLGLSLLCCADAAHAERADRDKPIQIIRSGTPGSLSDLLQAKQVYLWADLDLAASSLSAVPRTGQAGMKRQDHDPSFFLFPFKAF